MLIRIRCPLTLHLRVFIAVETDMLPQTPRAIGLTTAPVLDPRARLRMYPPSGSSDIEKQNCGVARTWTPMTR